MAHDNAVMQAVLKKPKPLTRSRGGYFGAGTIGQSAVSSSNTPVRNSFLGGGGGGY